jgi:hypothetical protein
VKKRLSELCGYRKYDLKVFFGEHEMTNTETVENLIPLGFRKDSEFAVKVILFDLCGFVDLIVKEDSLCVCLIMGMKGYVERV